MSMLQIVMLALGGLLFVGGVLMTTQRIRTVTVGRSASGRVVGHSQSTHSGSRGSMTTVYAPVVEFVHEGGKAKFTSTMFVRSKMAEGSSVPVRYLPSDPASTAEIATPMRMWGFPLGAIAVGALFVLLSVAQNG